MNAGPTTEAVLNCALTMTAPMSVFVLVDMHLVLMEGAAMVQHIH